MKLHRNKTLFRFTIINILWTILYAAIAFASFRYPSALLGAATQSMCWIVLAVVSVLAYDRRSTPLVGFVAFGIAGVQSNLFVALSVMPIMKAVGTRTGSSEYMFLLTLLPYHAVVWFGTIGYLVGVFVSSRNAESSKKPKELDQ